MTTLFVSDLHLHASRPAITALFLEFLEREAAKAEALYILGDLFEAWLGDDADDALAQSVRAALARLHAAGTSVFVMRGNRDFLFGARFAQDCGATLLPDPCVVLLYGQPTLLMHGDLLCTDDVAYQQFRAQTRQPEWQRQFLSQPLPARLAFAQQARAASKAHQSGLQQAGQMETITDVAPSTVAATFARYGIDTMIHGHTHRPAVHTHEGGTRIVLGDWYHQGSVLRVDAKGAKLSAL